MPYFPLTELSLRMNNYTALLVKGVIALSAFVLSFDATAVAASDSTATPKQAAQLLVTMRYEPERNFKDTTGTFSFFQSRIDAAVPLYAWAGSGNLINSIGLNIGLRYTVPEVSILQRQHDVYTVNPGFNYTRYKPNRYLWMNTFGTGFADDNYTVDNPNIRFLVSTLYENFKQDNFKWRAGVVVALVNKKLIPVPLLGANIKAGKHVRLFAGYPFNTRMTYKFSDEFQLYFSLKRRNEAYRIATYNEAIPNTTASVLLSKIEFPMTIGFKKTIAKQLYFSLEAGPVAARRMYFVNRDENISMIARIRKTLPLSLWIKRGPYFEASLRYEFGKNKKSADNSQSARILQILDPNDADIEDILEQH